MAAHRVELSAFFLDQYEVTNAQYLRFLNEYAKDHRVCPIVDGNGCIRLKSEAHGDRLDIERVDGRYVVAAGLEDHPVRGVTWEGADRYCEWAGKQLPSEAQWEYAARHDPQTGRDLRYPWGDDFELNRANCANDDCGDAFDETSPVGSFDGSDGRGDGTSPFGVHDMAGNVAELTADCFEYTYELCADGCVDPLDRNCRGDDQIVAVRNTSWDGSRVMAPAYMRGSVPVAAAGSHLNGFRCALTSSGRPSRGTQPPE